ncbi:hypothetical protein, partial [Aquipuribacter sp. MA13-6]|uniref:hypothetical protein n=1 Tax=unclassified Aquipuribacter TaxID=2635084 RepID=UPI003EEDFC65
TTSRDAIGAVVSRRSGGRLVTTVLLCLAVAAVGVWMTTEAVRDWRRDPRSTPRGGNTFRYTHTVGGPVIVLLSLTGAIGKGAPLLFDAPPPDLLLIALGVPALLLAPLGICLYVFERPRWLIPPVYKNADGSFRRS